MQGMVMYNEIQIPFEERNTKAKSPIQWETEKKKTQENQSAKENITQENLRKRRANPSPKKGKGAEPRSLSYTLP